MEMKIPAIAITAVVVITVLAGVLMPVLNDVTTTQDTYRNNGLFYANSLNANTSTSIEWDHNNPTLIKIGGASVDMDFDSPYSAVTIASSEDWLIRYALEPTSIVIGIVDSTTTSIATASTENEKDLSITIESGSVSMTVGTDSYNYSVDGGFIISPDNAGEYVMKSAGDVAYVNSDSQIYAAGRTGRPFGTGTALSVIAVGSIADNMVIRIAPTSYTFGEVSFTYVENSTHEDLYELTGFAFDVSNGSQTTTATYNQILVPAEVSAERSEHLADNQAAILKVVPIMVIIALLIAVVAVVFRSRQF